MTYRVLVVDDSSFFLHRLKDIINEHPQLDVVGLASNGQQAIDLEEQLRPDIISMDYEMPLLDGVSAVKAILTKRKVPIIMFSSLTYEGAKLTIDALEAGAVDFISKNFAAISQDSVALKNKLHNKLLLFAQQSKAVVDAKPTVAAIDTAVNKPPSKKLTSNSKGSKSTHSLDNNPVINRFDRNLPTSSSSRKTAPTHLVARSLHHVRLIVIGASTGGPVAVNQVLQALPANFPIPIVVVQHMPANFTRALAERLNRVCTIAVKEAANGEQLSSGSVLIAQGGCQLMFEAANSGRIKVLKGDDRLQYKPSVDVAFASAANAYGQKALGIVLTGMGSDGCEGAKIIKQKGGALWVQDQQSCVVYGMPRAIADAGLVEAVLNPEAIGQALAQGVR